MAITLTVRQKTISIYERDKGNVPKIVYDVTKIKNSTRWQIGQRLEKREIDDAIETLKVEVIIQ